MALQTATLAYQIAEDRYKLQSAGDLDLQIAAQQVQVHLAELALQQAQEQTDPSLQRNVDKAKLSVDAIQRQLDDRQLRAPYAGQVVAVGLNTLNFQSGVGQRPKVGDNMQAFAPLIILAKPGQVEIDIAADATNATSLSVGQALTITQNIGNAQPFTATVLAIPVQTLSTGDKPAQPQAVRIALPTGAPAMSIGDYVNVEVINAVHNDALFLPPAAVRTFMDRTFVVVQAEGKQRRVDVTTGLSNSLQIEIVSGLQEGDVVVGQ
jgi:multidrug efflux pump subunit AcrA (membrane-fusion protein)